jgi:DNA-binding IclR family transcriptional regulator
MAIESGERRRRMVYRVKRPSDRRSMSRSATRALDVLEQFGQLKRPLRAVEISKLLELQPSTTDQLLKTMVDSAHLVFDVATKSYLPSPRLVEFGLWLAEGYGGDARLRGLLRDIELEPGEVATLSTPNDLFMQILDIVTGGPSAPRPERGLRASIFSSAIGAAYLSTLPDAEIARLAERGRIPDHEVPQLLQEAARTRAAGFADGPSPDEATWSLGVPLPNQGFGASLVLGMAGRPERLRDRQEDVHASLRSTIERWMGAA